METALSLIEKGDKGSLGAQVLALLALCLDPAQFYGHNLVSILQHHTEYQVESTIFYLLLLIFKYSFNKNNFLGFINGSSGGSSNLLS